jgi:cytidyltransferase-like protein
MKYAITSMYANPIHPGHIECLRLSKELCDELWVIINNDKQAELKRGVPSFQDEQYRKEVVGAIKYVDHVFISTDSDGSVCKTLNNLFLAIKNIDSDAEVIFTKGGDRFVDNIPEKEICDSLGIKIVDSLGDKTHHSSQIISVFK